MATRRERGILVGKMVVGTYTKRYSFICCLRGRRCAIDWLGFGRRLLTLSPPITPNAAPPSPSPNPPPAGTLQSAVSCKATSGRRALMQRKKPVHAGGDR